MRNSENEQLKDGANSITVLGTYGPATGEKTFTGTVDINTNATGTITLRNLSIKKPQGVTHSIIVNAPNATIVLENVKVNGVLINDISSSSLHLKGNTIIEGELSIKDKNDNARVVVEGKAEIQGNTLVNSGATLLAQGTSQKPFGNVEVDLKDKNKILSLDGEFKDSSILVKSPATLDLKSDKPAKNIEAKADIEIKAENADILVKAFGDIKKDDKVSIDISDKVKDEVKKEAMAILELNKAHKDLAITYADGDHKDSVTKDLTLGLVSTGISITWESNNSQVITNAGKVTRPLDGKDVEVKLTATLTKGNKEMKRTFIVTVKAVSPGEIDVVDIKESELEEHIVGTYYVTLRLKTGLDYSKYTAKIKGADIEMVYDSVVKAFFYETSLQGAPEDITIIVTEKATGKTQEVTIVNSKSLTLSVVNEAKLALVEAFTSVYYVKVALKDGLNYSDFTATIKGGKALSYEAELGTFFLESSEGGVPSSLVIVVTEKTTGKTQEITINK